MCVHLIKKCEVFIFVFVRGSAVAAPPKFPGPGPNLRSAGFHNSALGYCHHTAPGSISAVPCVAWIEVVVVLSTNCRVTARQG